MKMIFDAQYSGHTSKCWSVWLAALDIAREIETFLFRMVKIDMYILY